MVRKTLLLIAICASSVAADSDAVSPGAWAHIYGKLRYEIANVDGQLVATPPEVRAHFERSAEYVEGRIPGLDQTVMALRGNREERERFQRLQGMLRDMREQHRAYLRNGTPVEVDAPIDFEESLPDGSIYPFNMRKPAVGDVGGIVAFKVQQVIDEDTALLADPFSRRNTGITVWAEGIDFSGAVDGESMTVDEVVKISGTKTYTTALGGTKTVMVIEAVDLDPYRKGVAESELRELIRQADLTERELLEKVQRADRRGEPMHWVASDLVE